MWIWPVCAIGVVLANVALYLWNPSISGSVKLLIAAADLGGTIVIVKGAAELVKVGAEIKKLKAELAKLKHEERQRTSLITPATAEESERFSREAIEWQEAQKRRIKLRLQGTSWLMILLIAGTGIVGFLRQPNGRTIGENTISSFVRIFERDNSPRFERIRFACESQEKPFPPSPRIRRAFVYGTRSIEDGTQKIELSVGLEPDRDPSGYIFFIVGNIVVHWESNVPPSQFDTPHFDLHVSFEAPQHNGRPASIDIDGAIEEEFPDRRIRETALHCVPVNQTQQ